MNLDRLINTATPEQLRKGLFHLAQFGYFQLQEHTFGVWTSSYHDAARTTAEALIKQVEHACEQTTSEPFDQHTQTVIELALQQKRDVIKKAYDTLTKHPRSRPRSLNSKGKIFSAIRSVDLLIHTHITNRVLEIRAILDNMDTGTLRTTTRAVMKEVQSLQESVDYTHDDHANGVRFITTKAHKIVEEELTRAASHH